MLRPLAVRLLALAARVVYAERRWLVRALMTNTRNRERLESLRRWPS